MLLRTAGFTPSPHPSGTEVAMDSNIMLMITMIGVIVLVILNVEES
jgi:hypothetical protein